jgi:hypothetical protein
VNTQIDLLLTFGQLGVAPWQLIPAIHSELLNRLSRDFPSLQQAFNWRPLFGIKTGLNEAFVIDADTRRKLITEDRSSDELIRPILFGRDVKRYQVYNENRYVIYLHPNKDINDYPSVKRHLEKFRANLSNRAASQKWYELQQPATSLIPLLEKPKIIYPIIAPEPRFALDDKGFLINDKLFVLPTDSLFLLGILNSSLADFFFSSVCARLEGSGDTYYEFRAQFVERFPVRTINFSNDGDKARHDKMVSLAERMLELQRRNPRTPQDQEIVKREIASTDRQIDSLVYDLYGLTDDEIKIIAGIA